MSPPALLWAFALVATAFLGSTVYSDLQERSIDAQAIDLQSDAIPSLEHLAEARTALRHLETAAEQFAEPASDRHQLRLAIDRSHEHLVHALMGYLAIPLIYPGERAEAARVDADLDALDRELVHLQELAHDGAPDDARTYVDGDVRSQFEKIDDGIRALSEINAKAAQDAALQIVGVRHRTTWLALGLDALCVVVAVLAAGIATRAVRRQAALERTQAELLERRAEDLELFAKRVAHDLLSPLSALSFSLAMVRRASDKGQGVAEPISRAAACLKRAQRLVDGVFDFARAGGSRHAQGKAELRESLDGVLDEVRSDDGPQVELVVEPFEDLTLACSPGVLTSVLSNLIRNAVKYMHDRPEPRVTVRVARRGAVAHVEVEDTGPGLAPGLEEHLFEPYVRGPETGIPGLGLGLSTVRRFVEAHGGVVGVSSVANRGCIFWFDLPTVPTAPEAGVAADLSHRTPARSA